MSVAAKKQRSGKMGYQEEFIEFMIRANVLRFGDFTAKSGRKTPYFINSGNYQTGEQIARLGDFYAASIVANRIDSYDFIFGPAYKGIPLVVAVAIALNRNHQINVPYCFNRKEVKDHGEGGVFVGYQPQDGDRALIIEDVITAGTAIRESLNLLKRMAAVKVTAILISVDRMEKGIGDRSALQELREDYGIETYAIVNIREILRHLCNEKFAGPAVVDEDLIKRIENYLALYGSDIN
jgi:orotate phosphoribosyltransferase